VPGNAGKVVENAALAKTVASSEGWCGGVQRVGLWGGLGLPVFVARPLPARAAGYTLVGMADMRGAPGSRYRRPYAVAESLDRLHGPVSGTVHLPAHLDWSGRAEYDLDAPGRIVDLYRAVLNEAASPQDLYEYLDARTLRRLWAMLWLPVQLRGAWERKFPVLAEISRVTAA
jgi:hypothetical protein